MLLIMIEPRQLDHEQEHEHDRSGEILPVLLLIVFADRWWWPRAQFRVTHSARGVSDITADTETNDTAEKNHKR